MRSASRAHRRAIILSAATLGLFVSGAQAVTNVSFQGGTTRLTHTPDSGNGAVTSSQSPITGTPVSSDRLNSGGFSLNGTNALGNGLSTGKAKVAHVTNATTATLILRSGTGVTQSDPTNNYLGFSRTAIDIISPLTWSSGTLDEIPPSFSRYASFTVAGNVGTGGFARFTANLTFRDGSNSLLGAINLTTGSITTAGPFSRTLTAAGPLNLGPGDNIIRITGSINFDASNDESPTVIDLIDGEAGGTQGNTFIYEGGSRNWTAASSWTNSTGGAITPNSIGDHVIFASSGATPLLAFDQVNIAAGAMQAFGTIDVSGVNKIVDINGLGGSTLTTGGAPLNRPNLRTQPGTQLRINRPLTVVGNGISVATEGSSSISLNNNPVLASGSTGSLNIAKTGAGTLILGSGALSTPLAIHSNQGAVEVTGSGVLGTTLSVDAQPSDGETAVISIARPVTLTGIHVYDRGTVRLQRFLSSDANLLLGGNLFVETGGVLDMTNSALDLLQPAGTLDPYHLFVRYIKTGYADGAWTGTGINSSTAAADTSRRTGIGYVRAPGPVTGRVAYALYGDSDLSGSVDLNDFTALAASFGTEGDWGQGDSNYDGLVNLDDFTALAANFGLTLPADAGRASVPEPAGLLCVGVTALAPVLRRRR